MAKKPPTALAAALQLHGVDTKQLKAVNHIVRELSINVGDYDFGPAYERAKAELEVAQSFMQRLVDKL